MLKCVCPNIFNVGPYSCMVITGRDFFPNEFPRGHYLVWLVRVKG